MKRHQFTALVSILREAGIRSRTASRIEMLIDGDSYVGLTADDVASALLSWCNHEADRLFEDARRFEERYLVHPDAPGQITMFEQ